MEQIKKIRKELGIKQKYIAERIKMIHQNYSSMENGTYTPSNVKELELKAAEVLKPLLIQKILDTREDLERLESMMITLN